MSTTRSEVTYIHELERRYETLLGNLPGVVFRCKNDPDWTLEFISEGSKKLTGYRQNEFTVPNAGLFRKMIHPDDVQSVWDGLQSAIDKNEHFSKEFRIFDKNGKRKWVWEQAICVKDLDGSQHIEGFIQDITEKKRLEAETKKLTRYDPLTWLPNHYYINEYLEKLFYYMASDVESIAVLVINVNGFRKINDTHGVLVGDDILKQMSRLLKNVVESEDLAGRLESDKFIIVSTAKKNSEHKYGELAKKIITLLGVNYKPNNLENSCSVSVGIAMYPASTNDKDELIKQADYAAKEAEQGAYMFYNAQQHKTYLKDLIMEDEIRLALKTDQFYIVYQPVMDIKKNTCVAFESLVRWEHPEKGLIMPDEFIPIAEESGLIRELENYIVDRALCQFVKILKASPSKLRLAINVSAAHVNDDSLKELFKEKIHDCGVDPTLLEVELTETSFSSIEKNNINVKYFIAQGITLVIDDFGTGQSSLNRLYMLPFKKLKIDQFFVQNSDHESFKGLLKTMIDIGKSLDMEAIAEGVETEKHHKLLLKYGCKYAQGFYYSKPLSYKDTLQYVKGIKK